MWAPKLGRQITLASRWTVYLWVTLEADPSVTTYCERPALIDADAGGLPRFVDFWVRRDDQSRWLMLERHDETMIEPEGENFQCVSKQTVEIVSREALERRQIWIENWLSILPYLASHTRYVDLALISAILDLCQTPQPLQAIKRYFPQQDAGIVRTGVFLGAHRGQLSCEELNDRPWDESTVFSRNPP